MLMNIYATTTYAKATNAPKPMAAANPPPVPTFRAAPALGARLAEEDVPDEVLLELRELELEEPVLDEADEEEDDFVVVVPVVVVVVVPVVEAAFAVADPLGVGP